MPGMTGIELARHISARAGEGDSDDPKPMPLMIFVTAFDQFAVAAFEVAAVDYLMKPIEPARLAAALVDRLAHPRRALATTAAGLIVSRLSSTSANTGRAPVIVTASAV